MKFGENLRNLRKSKQLSQEDLAEKVGVSRQSVSKWECSEAYPEMNNILAICDIFHCKINDIVHEDFVDIDSLDEEIKMSVVKFKKEKQKQIKGLSKAIYILARIGKVMSIIGLIGVIIAMIAIPVVVNNLKVEENKIIEIFDNKIEYQEENGNVTLFLDDANNTVVFESEKIVFDTIIDKLENKTMTVIYLEIAFTFLIVTLIFLYLAMIHLEKLFININTGDTPFTLANVNHIKKIAMFMIFMIIVPNISALIFEIVAREELDIGFELFDFVYILFLFSMALIFEYGYQIQLDSKGKMYGEETE